jgi:limonene-1,2-epoxide hydrolase
MRVLSHAQCGRIAAMTRPMPSARTAETDVVVGFLHALECSDLDAAFAMVAEDLVYINVSLPTIRGRRGLDRAFRPMFRPGRMGFAVRLHHVAADSDVVLTDRTDEISLGRFRARFWVYGRFVVRDGQIAVWRDSFDWFDVTVGMLRGLAGILVPAANRQMPS